MAKINTAERIALMRLMPEKTGFADRIVVRAMIEELSIDEEEKNEIGLYDMKNGSIGWMKDKQIDFNISKDRDRLIRKGITEFVQSAGIILDGFSQNIFDNLKWTNKELKELDKVVDKMDKNEQITERVFDVCKRIKDKIPQEKSQTKK
ncbi:MAG: hypothetical protein R6U52_00255 [Kosmotogaceae bacterium]